MIFLSHATPDKPFVRFVGEELRACGLSYWLDAKDLLPGDELTPTIERAVAESGHVLVFLSAASVGSRWVQLEIDMAGRAHGTATGRLIPCLTGAIGPEALPPALADILCIDLREPKLYESQMVRLLRPLAARRRSIRWPGLDAARSGHLVELGADPAVARWIQAWLLDTTDARADPTERYWAYLTLARIGDGGVRAYLEARATSATGIARRGALDGLAIVDGRHPADRTSGEIP